MGKRFYLILAMLLTPGIVSADSIRVGDAYYWDVYIREGKDFYSVYHPTGRMERVSKRRSNVSEVVISDDTAYREGLLARYNAKAGVARAESEPVRATPKLAAPAVEISKPIGRRLGTTVLDGDLLKHRRQMKDLAEFEAQLAHWKTLPEALRKDIQAGLYETLAQRTARRAADREKALVQLNQLDGTKAEVQNQLASAAYARDVAVQEAQATDSSDFYLNAYENSKGYIQSYTLYYDECERLRSFPTLWYTEDESLYDAALAERARTLGKIDAADDVFAWQASAYGNQLNAVERAMSQQERAANAAVAKALDEQRHFGDRQARAAALENAAKAGYLPRMRALPIASWAGISAQTLAEFTAGEGVWRLDCRLTGAGAEDGFAVTVYDAETDKPFTRIAGADFLGMRTRVFDEPGRYYVAVEQGVVPVAFEIEVSAQELR